MTQHMTSVATHSSGNQQIASQHHQTVPPLQNLPMGHAGQIAAQINTSGGRMAPQVNLGPTGHMPSVSMHSSGPPQITQMNLGQGHLNVGSITMPQASQMGGISMQGQMPPVSLGPPMLNGGGEFGGTFQGIHHDDLGIGQNEINMISQVPDFPIMDSHIGVFESTD